MSYKNNRKHLAIPENFTTYSLRHTNWTLLASMCSPVEARARLANTNPQERTYVPDNCHSPEFNEPARDYLQKIAEPFNSSAVPNIALLKGRKNVN